jgi:CRP/FNR family transcriptional regulator, cyclic AMP receptor protein
MSVNARGMTLEALRSVPLFGSLDDQAATDLRELLTVEDIPVGTQLFHKGDSGDAMYLIESGRIRISITDQDAQEVTLADLAQGDFFGEMAIIDGRKRSADARVVQDARLAILSRPSFLAFVRANPDVALEMLSALSERLRRTDELLRSRVSRNVNEEQALRLTLADRAADMIAEFGGSWKFIGVSIALIIFWILFNSYVLLSGFDPKPYQMLNLVLAVIAGMQAPIIMMSQNRQGQKDRLRADLDYRVNLKNELSLAEVLRRLDVLESERLPKLFEQQNAKIAEVKNPKSNVQSETTNVQSPKSNVQSETTKVQSPKSNVQSQGTKL